MGMKYINSFCTGYRRGYIKVKDRMVESNYIKISDSLNKKTKEGRILAELKNEGCTHYTVAFNQHSNSNRFYYICYKGYKEQA